MTDFSNNPAGLPPLAFTHGGRFHADDVFSTALLRILRPDIRVYRGFAVPKGFSGIVYDIGDGPFDHHAKGSPRRENGVPFAAFGLLWREYGRFILPEGEAKRFDEKFIQPLDLDDNTGSGNILAALVGDFNPLWDADEDPDTAFAAAVDVAHKLLSRRLEGILAVGRAQKQVETQLKKMIDRIVVLDGYLPWKPVVIPSEAEFVIFPSQRGGFSVQCVPRDFNGKTGNKVPMPAAWRGKPAEELARLSGVADALFCHASGFMATVASLEGAKALCRAAQREEARRREQSAADRNAAQQATGSPLARASEG